MRNSRVLVTMLCVGLVLAGLAVTAIAQQNNRQIGINVVLKIPVTRVVLADLGKYGRVRDVIPAINAVTLQAPASQLAVIRALPYVAAANPDAKRTGAPIDTVAATDFTAGLNTWDLDAINVTDFTLGRTVSFDGSGVYVAVLDTGLLDSWRQYFPQERIAVQYAKSSREAEVRWATSPSSPISGSTTKTLTARM